jgi:amino acid adenylation domain-containing protein
MPGRNRPLCAGSEPIVEHPLSCGQRALWFLQQLSPASPAYNSIHAAYFPASLDVSAFGRAFQGLVARHPCLRTTFASRAGAPVQRVHARGEGRFEVVDAEGWSEADLEARLSKEAYRPFDLERGPLARFSLFRRRDRFIGFMNVHHIAVDLWSWAILLHELGSLYTSERAGVPADLPPLDASYAEHVRAESALLAGPEGERLWSFWRERLAGEVQPLCLPADRPRPDSPTYRGAAASIRIDAELAGELRALGKGRGATPFRTLLAAFQVLLHRYSGQEDVLVGCPAAGRSDARFAPVVGYFANLFVVRADLSGDPSFTAVLDRVNGRAREAVSHSQFPHALVVERLHPTRSGGESPLVQTVFAWQATPRLLQSERLARFALEDAGGALQLGDLCLESAAMKARPAPFPLTLLMAESGDELIATAEYQTDRFSESSIRRLLERFATLLRGIARDPDAPISRLPLLTGEDRAELAEWSQGADSSPLAPLVHDAIAARSAASPESVAVAQGYSELAYGELDERSNRLANHLRKLGVGPEVPVGVHLDRSFDLVVALLAILRAGGVYLPLDPDGPAERLAFMLSDARPRVVLTDQRLRRRLPDSGARVVCMDGDAAAIAAESAQGPAGAVAGESAAYVIYTSGSTGQPKGVVVPHSAIAAHCRDVIDLYELWPGDRVLQFASPCFDASLEQVLPTLMCGARLVLRGRDVASGEAFHGFVARHGLTVVNVPPAYWGEWARAAAGAEGAAPNRQLRLVIIGGDVMPSETLALWQRTPMAGARLLNAYGPTETTITAAVHDVAPRAGGREPSTTIPIGRPVGARTFHVLGSRGEVLPVGIPGELHIGGEHVARGYLDRPELTAQKFVADPFDRRPGARLYRTGDLVRWLPDGSLEFLGRLDDQVKIRGYRVEIQEVEAALQRHPAVREAAVVAHAVARGGPPEKCLVAYVAARGEDEVDAAELRRFLGERLPDFMVPSAFVAMSALPRSAGGKVDRRALPLPGAGEPHAPYVEPRGPVEAQIARIFGEVLQVDCVGIRDDFFALGGHSLLATRVVSRLREAFGVDLPLRRVFENPTVEGLALAVAALLAAGEDEEELDALLEEIEGAPEEAVRAALDEGERAAPALFTPPDEVHGE